jgi:hypothetical protein
VGTVDFAGNCRGERRSGEAVFTMLKGQITLHPNSYIGRLASELSWVTVVLAGSLAPLLIILSTLRAYAKPYR